MRYHLTYLPRWTNRLPSHQRCHPKRGSPWDVLVLDHKQDRSSSPESQHNNLMLEAQPCQGEASFAYVFSHKIHKIQIVCLGLPSFLLYKKAKALCEVICLKAQATESGSCWHQFIPPEAIFTKWFLCSALIMVLEA